MLNKEQRRRNAAKAGFAAQANRTPEQRRAHSAKMQAARNLKYPPRGRKNPLFMPHGEEEVDIPGDAFKADDECGEWEVIEEGE